MRMTGVGIGAFFAFALNEEGVFYHHVFVRPQSGKYLNLIFGRTAQCNGPLFISFGRFHEDAGLVIDILNRLLADDDADIDIAQRHISPDELTRAVLS